MFDVQAWWARDYICGKIQLPSKEEMTAYKIIKSADYISTYDIGKFIGILVRKDTMERDPNNKEKIFLSCLN